MEMDQIKKFTNFKDDFRKTFNRILFDSQTPL